jgi:hypothetical protein
MPIPREDAEKLAALFGEHDLANRDGTASERWPKALREAFPEHEWRVILDRSGYRTRWALSLVDDDPREHYIAHGRCVLCDKTDEELRANGVVCPDRTIQYEARE